MSTALPLKTPTKAQEKEKEAEKDVNLTPKQASAVPGMKVKEISSPHELTAFVRPLHEISLVSRLRRALSRSRRSWSSWTPNSTKCLRRFWIEVRAPPLLNMSGKCLWPPSVPNVCSSRRAGGFHSGHNKRRYIPYHAHIAYQEKR